MKGSHGIINQLINKIWYVTISLTQKGRIHLVRRYISSVAIKGLLDDDSYLSKLPAVKYYIGGQELTFSSDVTFLFGENGTGKSTLLEAIAIASGFNAEGGTINFYFSTNKTHSDLYKCLVITKIKFPRDGFFLRAESFYNVATNIDEIDSEPSFAPRLTTVTAGFCYTGSHMVKAFFH